MKKVALLLLTCCLFLYSNVFAENKKIVGVCDPWPPFIDPESPTQGFSMEIVRAAYDTQGYEVELKPMPWARAMRGAKEGVYDILATVWKTAERETFLMFSQPYAENKIKFIKKKGDPFEYKGISSLAGKKIGIIRDYSYGEDFNNATGFDKEEVSKFELNIKKLIAGRVDLTIEDEIVARARIAKENIKWLDEVAFCRIPLSSEKLYIASGLKNSRHKELMNAFNTGLAKIKANGVYGEIMSKYGLKQN